MNYCKTAVTLLVICVNKEMNCLLKIFCFLLSRHCVHVHPKYTHLLIHWGLVTPYGGIDLGQHWLRLWLVAWQHQAIAWTMLTWEHWPSTHTTSTFIVVSTNTQFSFQNIFPWIFLPLPRANELTVLLWLSVLTFNSLASGRYPRIQGIIVLKCNFWQVHLLIYLYNWYGLEAKVLKSTLVQVMACCCKATSHNLSQYWPRYMLPYGVTWPQWVTYCLNSTDIAFFTALVIVFGKHKSIINLRVPYLMIIHGYY